jgi:GntR family transcriptional regulator
VSRSASNDSEPRSRIERASPVPLYYQLQEILKQQIEDGQWEAGGLLPSEAELAAAHRISRTVIRKALDVLEGDGQVYRIKGKGTVVAPPKFRYEAVAAAREWLTHDERTPVILWKLIHLSSVPAGGPVSRLLQVSANEELWEAAFVSAIDAQPVSLSQMYIRRDASRSLRDISERGELPILLERQADPLEQLADRYGVQVSSTEITIESTAANEFESREIGVPPGTPVFLLALLAIDRRRQPVAFTRTVVRSDHFRFSVAIPGPADSLAG